MFTEYFEKALKEIDRFNSQDPRQKIDDGIAHPQELIYSKSLPTGYSVGPAKPPQPA